MAITRLGPNQDITAAKIAGQINFKNLIINGDMSIAQRATSVSSLTAGGYKTVDRWELSLNAAGTWTVSQSTTVPTGQGFASSMKFDCTTANASLASGAYFSFRQKLEGQNLQQLKKGTANAESLTLSFWVRSNKTGTYQANIRDMDNSRIIGSTYTINSADTWEKKTLTFAGDTTGTLNNDNGDSLRVEWFLAAGSNNSSGSVPTSWQTNVEADRGAGLTVNLADNTANEWYITGVQLEADTSASDFEFLPYDVNLRRCQRYCAVYGKNAPGATNYGPFPGMAMCVGSTTNVELQLIHPVDLRTADVSVSSSSVHVSNIVSQGSDISSINIRSSNKGIRATNFYATASSALTQDRLFYIMTANTPAGYMIVDAEL